MKLSKLLNVFQQKNLIDESTLQRDFTVLREYASMMFPLSSENDARIADVKFGNLHIAGNTTDDYLIYNTRNNEWLAHNLHSFVKFMQKMEKRNTQPTKKPINTKDLASLEKFSQPNIPYKHVKKFVETDPLFNQKRNDYEEDLVRAQIKFMMQSDQPNGLLMHSAYNHANHQFFVVNDFNPQTIHQELNADQVFRNGVVKAMSQLGIAEHSIEASLEKHADLWRKQMMTQAYYNHYPLSSQNAKLVSNDGVDEVINVMREGFKDTWLAQRENQYYQDHRAIIDELNLATPNMKLNAQVAKTLDEKVAWWENHYFSMVQSKQTQFAQTGLEK